MAPYAVVSFFASSSSSFCNRAIYSSKLGSLTTFVAAGFAAVEPLLALVAFLLLYPADEGLAAFLSAACAFFGSLVAAAAFLGSVAGAGAFLGSVAGAGAFLGSVAVV